MYVAQNRRNTGSDAQFFRAPCRTAASLCPGAQCETPENSMIWWFFLARSRSIEIIVATTGSDYHRVTYSVARCGRPSRIAAAGLSTVFPIILIAPWLISDYTGKPRNIRSPLYRILGFIGILFCFGLQILEQRPPAMMIFSQAFQACILPAVALPIFLFINNQSLMGEHKADYKMNIGLVAVILFALVTTYLAIFELL